MNEYKIKVRDTAKVEKIQKENYQRPALQTREELTEFLIQSMAYPYRSKKGTVFFRRIKPQDEDGGLFERLINKAYKEEARALAYLKKEYRDVVKSLPDREES